MKMRYAPFRAREEHFQENRCHTPVRPIDAIAQGTAKDVAVLVGTNRDEMKLFFAGAQAATPDERMLKQAFGAAAVKVLAAYTAARPDASPSDAWVDILTDRSFRIPAIRLAEQQSQQGAHVWMYRFDWITPAFGGRLGPVMPSSSPLSGTISTQPAWEH